MKTLPVLIWLLVGVFYWWLHNDYQQACCQDQTTVLNHLEMESQDSLDIDHSESSSEMEDLPKAPISFFFRALSPLSELGLKSLRTV